MKTQFAIRLATKQELERIADIHVECFSEIGETRESFLAYVSRPDVQTRAAFDGDRVAGYTASTLARGSSLYLAWFGVTKSARKQGAGKALYAQLKALAVQERVPAIELVSRNRFRDAMHFYVNHGFDLYGTFVGMDKDIMLQLRATLPINN